MSGRMREVILLEASPALARVYRGFLRDEPIALRVVDTIEAAQSALKARPTDAIVVDLSTPAPDGLTAIENLRKDWPNLPILALAADGSIGLAVSAMRAGAADFLVKPFGADRFTSALTTALSAAAPAPAPHDDAQDPPPDDQPFIGRSPQIHSVHEAIKRCAASDAPVFITGESGSGKEVAALAVHQASPRAQKPFIAINCAAIPSELMESEMFGSVKGAFTGAVADRTGAVKAADGGTLFLDELCELALPLQSKLLRFAQSGSFNPVGRSQSEQVNVRLVCATNRDPRQEVEVGRLREDLFYRLHVLPIRLPPLRERTGDARALAEHFLKNFAIEEGKQFQRLSADAAAAIEAHEWPGNIRQLQNALRNAVVLHDGDELTLAMLPDLGDQPNIPDCAPPARYGHLDLVQSPPPAEDGLASLSAKIRPLADIERDAIERALKLCGGDVRKAAVFLDISPATIYRKQKAWSKAG